MSETVKINQAFKCVAESCIDAYGQEAFRLRAINNLGNKGLDVQAVATIPSNRIDLKKAWEDNGRLIGVPYRDYTPQLPLETLKALDVVPQNAQPPAAPKPFIVGETLAVPVRAVA